uniref:Uncharacterized protein n=1 Tax=Dicentrarchus labrax TaxID=13489 RepID=A0A8C4ICG5_DICLA
MAEDNERKWPEFSIHIYIYISPIWPATVSLCDLWPGLLFSQPPPRSLVITNKLEVTPATRKGEGAPMACQHIESCVLAALGNQMLTWINQPSLFIRVVRSQEWQ